MALPDVTTADPTSATADPTSAAAQAAESRQREASRLSRREGIVEFACGGGFLVAAVALALASHSLAGVSWPRAAVTVMALAVASRVIFDVGSSYTMPTQLVFVPMLFLLPPGA